MAFLDSRVSRFLIQDAGDAKRDLSAFVVDVRGLPGARALNEVTALGDSGARFIPGLQDGVFSLSGLFDSTASTGPDAVLGGLRSHDAAVGFEYGPEGTAAGAVKYSGQCWVVSYELRSRVGRLVEWGASLQVDGVVGRGAF